MTADTWTKSSEQVLQQEQVSNIHKHRDKNMRGRREKVLRRATQKEEAKWG